MCRNILIISGSIEELLNFKNKNFFKRGRISPIEKDKFSIVFYSLEKPPVELILDHSKEYKNLNFKLSYINTDMENFFLGKNNIKNGKNELEKFWSLNNDENSNENERYARNILYIFFPDFFERIFLKERILGKNS
jgi:hypothetical protein